MSIKKVICNNYLIFKKILTGIFTEIFTMIFTGIFKNYIDVLILIMALIYDIFYVTDIKTNDVLEMPVGYLQDTYRLDHKVIVIFTNTEVSMFICIFMSSIISKSS